MRDKIHPICVFLCVGATQRFNKATVIAILENCNIVQLKLFFLLTKSCELQKHEKADKFTEIADCISQQYTDFLWDEKKVPGLKKDQEKCSKQ
jgi:hypothetical protein